MLQLETNRFCLQGTIGSLDYTPEERRRLARKSVNFVSDVAGPISALLKDPSTEEKGSSESRQKEAKEIASNMSFRVRRSDTFPVIQ